MSQRHYSRHSQGVVLVGVILFATQIPATWGGQLRGEIVDSQTGHLLPARLYIQSQEGKFFLAKAGASQGSSVTYNKDRGKSVEVHTALSADPFVADLPPGEYTITAERGKEYLPATRAVTIGEGELEIKLPLRRWIRMTDRGWYSGDTHVHRTIAELPNLVLAEDLNVALPLTYWVTDTSERPSTDNKNPATPPGPKLITVDDTHVIWPVNTEYEIFTVNRRQHTLGAVFILNHREAFDLTVQPTARVAKMARAQGGLLDLDKHNWPWSMMLLPIMKVDLFELTNNHLWRTDFLFNTWYPEYAAEYMNIDTEEGGFTERGWMHFGFQNYYALLNCGFDIRPSGGTASGVHPVPLGFGRVYVHLDDPLEYGAWMRGLKEGRSFVTTGPMLMVQFNGEFPGHRFDAQRQVRNTIEISGSVESAARMDRIEVIMNGEITKTIAPTNLARSEGGFQSLVDVSVETDGASWVAVRCFEQLSNGRERFAHTGPVHIDVLDRPIRPRKAEAEYLVKRVEDELSRHRGVLPEDALDEYREAARFYREILANAR